MVVMRYNFAKAGALPFTVSYIVIVCMVTLVHLFYTLIVCARINGVVKRTFDNLIDRRLVFKTLDASQKLDILEMGKITTAKGIRMGTNQSRQVSFHYIRMLANDILCTFFVAYQNLR
jgi:hypothetical protein